MRGASTTPQEYISEQDQGLPIEEQTIFTIRCKNTSMSNESLRRYARARRDNADWSQDYDDSKLTAADVEEFISVCVKVTNYAWSSEYLESHPNVNVNESGFQVDPIVDADSLADVLRDLPSSVWLELQRASSNHIELKKGLKKS